MKNKRNGEGSARGYAWEMLALGLDLKKRVASKVIPACSPVKESKVQPISLKSIQSM